VEMSVCSTGIGCPSAAIALEELAKCGADTFIRVGSAGSWQRDVEPGSLVIATGALRRDGTSTRYAPLGFPAIAHGAVVSSLSEASSAFKVPVRSGVVLCDDAFYGPLEKEYIEQVESLGVLAVEMETSVLFTLGTIRGWRTGAILAIDGSIIQGRIKDPSAADAFKRAEAAALEAALLAMHRIASADQRRS
jgi:uridine phosphorylase